MFQRRFAAAIIGIVLLVVMTGPAGRSMAARPSQAVTLPATWTPGFANGTAGEVIAYPSAYPGQMQTLLTRAIDGRMRIEWEAEAPAPGADDSPVHFIWHAGLASGYGAHRFTLSVNGTPCATFASGRDTNDRQWSIPTACSGTLTFQATRIGNFNELFGLMTLSIPRRMVSAGKPRFSAVGEAANSQDYYLVFMATLKEYVRVTPEQALLKGGGRALRVEISHVADRQAGRVLSSGRVLWSGDIAPGYTSLFVPAGGPASTRLPVVVEIGGRPALSTSVTLGPVRRWEMHLLPHSHVDIGYSDPQPEVERKQWKNLRDAVALAAKTAAYPSEARFRWNVEGLWSVESYLRQASDEERKAFVTAVRAGSIGLQANYTNILTGLASPEELLRWTDAARQLRAAYGFGPIRTAMHTDIPGLSWSSVQALADGGVRYFSSGPNYMPSSLDGGDRIGATLRGLGDRPFWWLSPSGRERILFWMAGRGYSWFHGMNMGSIAKAGRTPILDYLRELNDSGYAWDMVQARYTIGGDNGPVDPELPDTVKTWNETFDSPKLVINTAEAMFDAFERRHGASLPTLRGDMTPYWEDGAVSSAAEESMARASARRLVQAESLWCMRNPATFPANEAAEAWRNVLLWHEHTWGAADSVSQPDRTDVVGQWVYKRQFALEAEKRSQALLRAALEESAAAGGTVARGGKAGGAGEAARPVRAPGGQGAMLVDVANTLSWPRTGVVMLPADASQGRDRVEANGQPVPSQRLKDGRLAVLVSVPALGATRLALLEGAPTPPKVPVRIDGPSIDNGVVRVALDEETGVLRSLRMNGGQELVDAGAKGGAAGLNTYLYVPGRDPATAQRAGRARVVVEDNGPLVATLRTDSEFAPGARSLSGRVTLTAGESAVSIEDVLDKTLVRAKESAHVAFPFRLPKATVRVDEGSAVVVPERDQLPGSCRDFIGVHSAIDLTAGGVGVSLASLDAPLLEIGGLTDERQDPRDRVRRWRTKTLPASSVYAYLLNNYWHTNYKADQEGLLVFRFVVRPHRARATVDANASLRRFGAEQEQPLLAYRVTPATPLARAPFRLEGPSVVVQSIRADNEQRGMLVRLYNSSSRPATVRVLAAAGTRVTPAGAMTLPPFGARMVSVRRPQMPLGRSDGVLRSSANSSGVSRRIP